MNKPMSYLTPWIRKYIQEYQKNGTMSGKPPLSSNITRVQLIVSFNKSESHLNTNKESNMVQESHLKSYSTTNTESNERSYIRCKVSDSLNSIEAFILISTYKEFHEKYAINFSDIIGSFLELEDFYFDTTYKHVLIINSFNYMGGESSIQGNPVDINDILKPSINVLPISYESLCIEEIMNLDPKEMKSEIMTYLGVDFYPSITLSNSTIPNITYSSITENQEFPDQPSEPENTIETDNLIDKVDINNSIESNISKKNKIDLINVNNDPLNVNNDVSGYTIANIDGSASTINNLIDCIKFNKETFNSHKNKKSCIKQENSMEQIEVMNIKSEVGGDKMDIKSEDRNDVMNINYAINNDTINNDIKCNDKVISSDTHKEIFAVIDKDDNITLKEDNTTLKEVTTKEDIISEGKTKEGTIKEVITKEMESISSSGTTISIKKLCDSLIQNDKLSKKNSLIIKSNNLISIKEGGYKNSNDINDNNNYKNSNDINDNNNYKNSNDINDNNNYKNSNKNYKNDNNNYKNDNNPIVVGDTKENYLSLNRDNDSIIYIDDNLYYVAESDFNIKENMKTKEEVNKENIDIKDEVNKGKTDNKEKVIKENRNIKKHILGVSQTMKESKKKVALVLEIEKNNKRIKTLHPEDPVFFNRNESKMDNFMAGTDNTNNNFITNNTNRFTTTNTIADRINIFLHNNATNNTNGFPSYNNTNSFPSYNTTNNDLPASNEDIHITNSITYQDSKYKDEIKVKEMEENIGLLNIKNLDGDSGEIENTEYVEDLKNTKDTEKLNNSEELNNLEGVDEKLFYKIENNDKLISVVNEFEDSSSEKSSLKNSLSDYNKNDQECYKKSFNTNTEITITTLGNDTLCNNNLYVDTLCNNNLCDDTLCNNNTSNDTLCNYKQEYMIINKNNLTNISNINDKVIEINSDYEPFDLENYLTKDIEYYSTIDSNDSIDFDCLYRNFLEF